MTQLGYATRDAYATLRFTGSRIGTGRIQVILSTVRPRLFRQRPWPSKWYRLRPRYAPYCPPSQSIAPPTIRAHVYIPGRPPILWLHRKSPDSSRPTTPPPGSPPRLAGLPRPLLDISQWTRGLSSPSTSLRPSPRRPRRARCRRTTTGRTGTQAMSARLPEPRAQPYLNISAH